MSSVVGECRVLGDHGEASGRVGEWEWEGKVATGIEGRVGGEGKWEVGLGGGSFLFFLSFLVGCRGSLLFLVGVLSRWPCFVVV